MAFYMTVYWDNVPYERTAMPCQRCMARVPSVCGSKLRHSNLEPKDFEDMPWGHFT